MDKCVLQILDNLAEGIVILNDDLEVIFLNIYMENLIKSNKEELQFKSIFEVFPNFKKDYFMNTFALALKNGNQYFFSSKIHKNIISEELNVNFKISRIEYNGSYHLLMEFVDITNEFVRVIQLKEQLNQLSSLNKELKTKEKEIKRLLYYDNLTNIGNRTLFYAFADKFLALAKRKKTILGLMFLDIDNFKDINDSFGHIAGDKALVDVANMLKLNVRESDMVFRFGGDEFLVLLPNLEEYHSYRIIAERIKGFDKKIKINDECEVGVSFSIGISFYPKDGDNIEDLILKADKAMYSVKKMGGNDCCQYGPDKVKNKN